MNQTTSFAPWNGSHLSHNAMNDVFGQIHLFSWGQPLSYLWREACCSPHTQAPGSCPGITQLKTRGFFRMNVSTSKLLTAAIATAAVSTGASADSVISFDGIPTLDTVTNQIPGLTVSASSPYADSPEEIFAWDFNGFPEFDFAGQQAPFTSGNATGRDLGQGLALRGPEGVLTGFGVLPEPIPTPLEKRRPAGTINLAFDTPLNSFGFTIVDVEGPEEFETNTGFFIDFLSNGVEVADFDFASFVTNDESNVFDPTIEFGNRSANQIQPITAAMLGVDSFDEVRISLGGSAVLAQVTVNAIPTPSAALAGLALLGAGALRRRTRGAAA